MGYDAGDANGIAVFLVLKRLRSSKESTHLNKFIKISIA
jgi:hypothetical protein